MTGAIDMIDLLRHFVAGLFLFSGAFFLIAGAIGMNRMPDLFTRMHAASVADTLGVSLMLIGMVFLAGVSLVAVKLILLIAFLLFMGPVASHALAAAALHAGVEPLLARSSPEKTSPEKTSPEKAGKSGGKGKPAAAKVRTGQTQPGKGGKGGKR